MRFPKITDLATKHIPERSTRILLYFFHPSEIGFIAYTYPSLLPRLLAFPPAPLVWSAASCCGMRDLPRRTGGGNRQPPRERESVERPSERRLRVSLIFRYIWLSLMQNSRPPPRSRKSLRPRSSHLPLLSIRMELRARAKRGRAGEAHSIWCGKRRNT